MEEFGIVETAPVGILEKNRSTLCRASSIAAGLRLADLGRWLGAHDVPYTRLVRCMPNTPALIGAGVSGLYAAAAVSAAEREVAARVMAADGLLLVVEPLPEGDHFALLRRLDDETAERIAGIF